MLEFVPGLGTGSVLVNDKQGRTKFWERKSLTEMTTAEWEALCDHCGKCCLHKLVDEDHGEVFYTRVSCQYLDDDCHCSDYAQRLTLVADCLQLRPGESETFQWLPSTCAYRLLSEGKPLADWHPLISGNPDSVHSAGMSVKGRVLNEKHVHPDGLEEHIIHWVS